MADTSRIKNWYLSLFKDFENRLNGEKSSDFHKVRREAIAKFAELDFPDLHQEDWQFTDISPILKHNFGYANDIMLPSKNEIAKFMFEGMKSHTLVFVNGSYSPELSALLPLPDGAIAGSLAAAMKQDNHGIHGHLATFSLPGKDAFTALNTAFAADGAYIYLPDDTIIEQPIHVLFISHVEDPDHRSEEKIISQPRNLIIAGKNSQANIIEHYGATGDGTYFTNAVTEVYLG
ncbi:MAG: hypothetical protein ACLP05_01375, partial [Candidatus Kryptoniota bacterium]